MEYRHNIFKDILVSHCDYDMELRLDIVSDRGRGVGGKGGVGHFYYDINF